MMILINVCFIFVVLYLGCPQDTAGFIESVTDRAPESLNHSMMQNIWRECGKTVKSLVGWGALHGFQAEGTTQGVDDFFCRIVMVEKTMRNDAPLTD
jgi:hypothetical protein